MSALDTARLKELAEKALVRTAAGYTSAPEISDFERAATSTVVLALIARVDALETLLDEFICDGRLQTFEDRERFRKAARAMNAPHVDYCAEHRRALVAASRKAREEIDQLLAVYGPIEVAQAAKRGLEQREREKAS